tara:strand:+ start:438410 stop:438682 length:273 start_codon:yes stop_codon:yes gene_type:complete
MANAGQFKKPLMSIADAHKRAMMLLDTCDDGIALFMVGGKITSTRKRSQSYSRRLKTLANNLIGVYDWYVDQRDVLEDIKEHYKMLGVVV